MELSQNMLVLAGQGTTTAIASVASRAISVSSDNIDSSAGLTPNSIAQVGSKGMAEFGNLLNIILELASSSENTGDKTGGITDLLNVFTSQTTNNITSNVLTNIPSPVITPENIVQNNGKGSQSPLLLPVIQAAPSDAAKKLDAAVQGIVTTTKSGINNPDTSILPVSEIIPVANKPSDGNRENKIIFPSVMAQTAPVDTSINNLQNPQEDKTGRTPASVTPASVTNDAADLTDKTLNRAAIISSSVTENIPAGTAPDNRNNSPPDMPIATWGSSEILQNSVKNFIEPQQAVTNQASVATQGTSDIRTPGQKAAPKKKTEILTSVIDTVASQQPLDQKNPAEVMASPVPQIDNQRLNLTPTASRENTAPQYAANPTVTESTSQVSPAGQLAAPLDTKPVVNNNIPAETAQARPQDKAPVQPFLNANAEQGAISPATQAATPPVQTQNLTSQPQPQPAVDGQGFAQTLARISEGLLAATPDGLQQSAGAQSAPGETGNIVLMDKPDSLRSATTPILSRAETPSPHVSPPIRDIAIHISQNTGTGTNRFQLRLDPPELGRVDVRMEISAEGKLSAVIAVERPETLDLLQRDSRALERSLMEAGLKTDSNSLSFSLKGGRQDNQHADITNNKTDSNGNPLSDDLDGPVAPITARFSNRAVNIHI